MTFFDPKTGGFVAFLKSKASITNVVGSGVNAKIYQGMAKQAVEPPYIVYAISPGFRVDGDSYRTHAGIVPLRETVVHVYCYGSSGNDAQANALAETVKIECETAIKQLWGAEWVDMVTASVPDDMRINLPKDASAGIPWRRVVLNIVHQQATTPT